MTPEIIGFVTLFGSIVALGVALFGTLKWVWDRIEKRFDAVDKRFDAVDKRFDAVDKRFERIEETLAALREGQARLEGMFEGAFERTPRVRPEVSEGSVASGAGS